MDRTDVNGLCRCSSSASLMETRKPGRAGLLPRAGPFLQIRQVKVVT